RRQRILDGSAERLGVELRLTAARREAAVGERAPVLRTAQARVALLPQPLVGNAVEPWMAARERPAQHRLVALEEIRLGAAQRRGETPKQLGVADRFAARRDRRPGQRAVQDP